MECSPLKSCCHIKFILQCGLTFEPSKGDRACSSFIRVDAGDASNEGVRVREIEDTALNESRDCRRSINFCSNPSAKVACEQLRG